MTRFVVCLRLRLPILKSELKERGCQLAYPRGVATTLLGFLQLFIMQ